MAHPNLRAGLNLGEVHLLTPCGDEALAILNSLSIKANVWGSATEAAPKQLDCCKPLPAVTHIQLTGSENGFQLESFCRATSGTKCRSVIETAESMEQIFANNSLHAVLNNATLLLVNAGKEDPTTVGQELLEFGTEAVLVKAGLHNGKQLYRLVLEGGAFWLLGQAAADKELSIAIAASMAVGLKVEDAVTLALWQIAGGGDDSFPKATFTQAVSDKTVFINQPSFPPLELSKKEIYPVVDSANWVERLAKAGAKIIQLRVKDKTGELLEQEVVAAIKAAELYGNGCCKLFINDYWQLAIKHSAYGVHLGQEDVVVADIAAIRQAGLRLGISSHCYIEAATSAWLRPSYIALGPIYETKLKQMDFLPQGVENLKTWRRIFKNLPLIAIGGITLPLADEVLMAEPDVIAVVRDITLNKKPELQLRSWQKLLNKD